MERENLLMVADSEHDANMLYAVGMFVPDPFVYLRLNGKPHLIMSDLEIDRARKEARHCRVISLARGMKQLDTNATRKPSLAHAIRLVLRRKRMKRVTVPYNFPSGLREELRALRVK